MYEKNIINCFNQFYKKASDYAFIGVCPSPKSKPNSSLVFMINHLINSSDYRESQFITNGIELINLVEDLKQKISITLFMDYHMHYLISVKK